MKYLAAYCMVALSGNDVDAASIKKVLDSIGAEIDNSRVEGLVNAMKGKQLHDVIRSGFSQFASIGGGVRTGGGASAAVVEEKKEEKKEEKVEEEEEEDVDMGDLFGDF